ncbi:MAG TPA: DOMON-like domain-containing protein [Rhizomicrobium sp.]|jgi:hypothetical protein|nr:DOMON-like domain-containing protein [Rhizomicrobium sp.]
MASCTADLIVKIMRQSLSCHPDTPCDAVTGIAVEVTYTPRGDLQLEYSMTGDIAAVRLPPPAISARADNLWQHTCFEAFIRSAPDGAGYHEFNFSPSTQWAAYRFAAYRAGMAAADAAPHVETRVTATVFELRAVLALPSTSAAALLALSAVIEETSGRKSYWALAHPPGKPDFHHPDCFSFELPPA